MTLSNFILALTLAASSSAFATTTPDVPLPTEFAQLSERDTAVVCSISLRVIGTTARVSKEFTKEEQDTYSMTSYLLGNVWTERALELGATGTDVTQWADTAMAALWAEHTVAYCMQLGDRQYNLLLPIDQERVKQQALDTYVKLELEFPR